MTYVDSDPAKKHNADAKAFEPQELTFDEMYTKFFPLLVNKARSYRVRDPEATVQDVFMKAYEHFGRDDTMHPGWLFRVLRNAAIDESRMAKRRNTVLESDFTALENQPDPAAENSFENVEFDETMDHIDRILAEKPDHWYDILFHRVVLNEKFTEISDDLKIPSSTVRTGLFRAAKTLADDPELRKMAGKK